MEHKKTVAEVSLEHGAVRYRARVIEGSQRGTVEVYAGDVLAGGGTWLDGKIAGRTSVLPDGAYEAIEAALRPQVDHQVTAVPPAPAIRR